jgi:uncharacterized membrane protein YbhN (UPF0104 family)
MNRAAAWSALRRWGPWALALLVATLLVRQAHLIDWHEVGRALRAQQPAHLVVAVVLAFTSHALFASYDLIGRRMTGHTVPVHRTLRIAAICYAFNLNFGSLVGALALRLRLYGREGLPLARVGLVIAYGLLTNWLGYLLLGGTVLLAAPPRVALPETALRGLGLAMLVAGLLWLALCTWSRRRRVVLRGTAFELPSGGVAAWQATVSAANWALMGGIVWWLLQGRLSYAEVLAVLLAAALAGVATHVPAGLGVLEAVFLSAFNGRIDAATLLAALLAYRAAYYLLPLLAAGIAYGWSETRLIGASAANARPRRHRTGGSRLGKKRASSL